MLNIEEIIKTAVHEHDGEAIGDLQGFIADTLKALSDLSSIPQYDPTSKPLSLVSFRCMLQDTGYPMEVYMPGEAVTDDSQVDWSKLKERWIGWGVEIPGETDWVQSSASASSSSITAGISRLALNGSTPSHSLALQSKYPLPDRKKDYLGALVKVYDESTSFKPASTHTFVGLLSTAALPSPISADDSEEPTLVPTLHVLQEVPASASVAVSDPESSRSALLRHLSTSLSVDEITAEYILLALLASPSVRPPALAPLGTLSLNLIGSIPNLVSTLSSLVPALVDLPLTLPTLHAIPFNPSSTSAETSSLDAGLLQLSEGTVLLIDETAMGDGGKLEEKAVKNLQALTECMAEQKVRYEYPYMDGLKMEAWIRPIVLSDGKSLIPVDIHLPVSTGISIGTSSGAESQPSSEAGPSTPPNLIAFRSYLQIYGSISHARTLSIPDPVASLIQDDFVSYRRTALASSASPGTNDAEEVLKRRMKIARLMAVSYPDAVLSKKRWERVVQMDEEAQRRMKERQADGKVNGTAAR